MKLYLSIILTSLCLFITFAQEKSIKELRQLSDEELLELVQTNFRDSIYAEKICRVYLNKSRLQKDTIKMARAYDRLSWLFNPAKNIMFADSIIVLTKDLKNKTYPGLGYLIKGGQYLQLRKYKEALDNFLTSFHYAQKNKNDLHLIYLEKQIIEILSVWGDPKEAVVRSQKLLKKIDTLNYREILKNNARSTFIISDSIIEQLKFVDKVEAKSVLNSSLLLNKNFSEARRINQELLNLINQSRDKFHFRQTIIRYGEIAFYTGQYKTAIDTIQKYKNFQTDPNTLLNNHYYIGMSYMNLDSITKGIKHLKLADSLYDEIGFILPSQKRLLSELSDYYAGIGDISTQLKYINKQIFLDSIYNKIYASINSRIIREYDTPRLIAQKEALIAQLEEEKSFLSKKSAWILAFLILSLGSIPFFVVRQRKLKKRFDTLIKSMDSEVKKIPKPVTKSSLSSEVIDEIMEKLQRFEDQQKYLSGSVSLQGVAKSFNTNSSYLSKVVNLHKDKNFSQYLNDLRIDYAINELTNNAKFRRYTIKAIAQDVGFGNSQSFSKAFHSKTGLQPSYFVRKLNKQAS